MEIYEEIYSSFQKKDDVGIFVEIQG